MSRYDKYDPKAGGFRAPANAAWTATSGPSGVSDLFRVTGVMLNGSGRALRATSALACVGITIAHGPKDAGSPLDIMTNGEVIELDAADIQGATSPTAGTKYYLDLTAGRLVANGAPTAGTNYFYVGTTVEANRLIVRTGLIQG